MKVAADRFESRIQTLSMEDFPTLPDLAPGGGVAINRELLRQMVMKTQFAITSEDTRYFLNGALFVVAARRDDARGDGRSPPGHREGAARGRSEGGGDAHDPAEEDALGARPPARRGEEEIRFARDESHIFFRIDGRLLVSRMIDGAVPRVRAGHPEEQRQARRVRARPVPERHPARRAAVERALARRQVLDRAGAGRDRVADARPGRGARADRRRVRRARP